MTDVLVEVYEQGPRAATVVPLSPPAASGVVAAPLPLATPSLPARALVAGVTPPVLDLAVTVSEGRGVDLIVHPRP